MFTGIVEELGRVVALEQAENSARLRIAAPLVCSDVGHGDSISVSGCCLTVTEHTDEEFCADVMDESLARTSLGTLTAGSTVNLERAVPAGGRLGGHLVSGHVDGTGEVLERQPGDRWELVRISVPGRLARYVAEKGSVAVDGVSLTVIEVADRPAPSFTVGLIPTTLAETTLGQAPPGTTVNLEVDVLAKYVERLLAGDDPDRRVTGGGVR